MSWIFLKIPPGNLQEICLIKFLDTLQLTNDRPQGQFTHFGQFQMAITLQRVNRSPSCLVLGWGFRGRQIERRHFWFTQNPRWRPAAIFR